MPVDDASQQSGPTDENAGDAPTLSFSGKKEVEDAQENAYKKETMNEEARKKKERGDCKEKNNQLKNFGKWLKFS